MRTAFTLLEILVVIIIIGILATFGIAQYYPVRERALGKEAIANLKLIAAAEKIYRMEHGKYYPGAIAASEDDVTDINDNLKLLLTETNWDYEIAGGSDNSFSAMARRQGSGGYLNCQYSLAYDDSDGEPGNNGSCP